MKDYQTQDPKNQSQSKVKKTVFENIIHQESRGRKKPLKDYSQSAKLNFDLNPVNRKNGKLLNIKSKNAYYSNDRVPNNLAKSNFLYIIFIYLIYSNREQLHEFYRPEIGK